MFGRQHTFNSWHHYTLYSFSARIILRNGRIVKWNGMDVSEKWMIFQFTPYQTTTLPKWMFFLKLFFKSSVLLNGQCGIQVHPQTAATTFAFLLWSLLLCSVPTRDVKAAVLQWGDDHCPDRPVGPTGGQRSTEAEEQGDGHLPSSTRQVETSTFSQTGSNFHLQPDR